MFGFCHYYLPYFYYRPRPVIFSFFLNFCGDHCCVLYCDCVMAAKRKRDPTFAASEKLILIELVEKYFNIVENKKTDHVTMNSKHQQWQIISNEFNASSNLHPRDSGALKTCWENMKKRAKQVNTMRNQHHLGTGGGPPKKFAEDPATERILELIQTRVTGFVNQFDSDGTLVLVAGNSTAEAVNSAAEANNSAAEANNSAAEAEGEATSVILDYQFETEVQTESAGADTCTLTADWSQYNQNMLREPRNPVLGRSPSPDVELREPEAQNLLPTVQTPLSAPCSATTTYARTSRRRPVLRRDQEQSLNNERIKTLLTTNAYAEEEHRLNIKILQLQEESEKEKLKQEKYKTEQEKIKLAILKIELEKLKE